MTKMWIVCFGAVALAVLIQIEAGNATTVSPPATTNSSSSASSSNSSDSSISGSVTTSGMNVSQNTTVNTTSTGRGSSLFASSSIFLLPIAITTSILYLSC